MQQSIGERAHLGILVRHAVTTIARRPIRILTPMVVLGLIVPEFEGLVQPLRDLPQRLLRGLPIEPSVTRPENWLVLGALWTLSVYALGFITFAAYGTLQPRDYRLRDATFGALQRLPGALIVSLVVTAAVRLGFEAFVIPGYVLLVILSLSVPIAFLERTTVVDSLRRSIRVVRTSWLNAAIIVIGLNIFISTLQYLGQFLAPTPTSVTLVATIVAAPIIALSNTLLVVLYATATPRSVSEP